MIGNTDFGIGEVVLNIQSKPLFSLDITEFYHYANGDVSSILAQLFK